MNYVDWIKEYKEIAQYTDDLIQKYIKRKKEVHTQAELDVIMFLQWVALLRNLRIK